ncbi:MAG TPA: hypothetical protein ENN09_01060, partial [Planctomycetes bacterium]|nr:hypothetical protein [Planctomycetota bacterium]
MIYISLALTSFMLGLSGAIVPGPLMLAVFNRATRGGILSGLLLTAGHGALEVAFALAALFAAAALGWDVRNPHPAAIGAVGMAGGLVLAGFGIITARAAYTTTHQSSEESLSPPNGYAAGASDAMAGALLSVVNPHWLTWWLTVGIAFLLFAYAAAGAAGFTTVLVFHVLS